MTSLLDAIFVDRRDNGDGYVSGSGEAATANFSCDCHTSLAGNNARRKALNTETFVTIIHCKRGSCVFVRRRFYAPSVMQSVSRLHSLLLQRTVGFLTAKVGSLEKAKKCSRICAPINGVQQPRHGFKAVQTS